MEAQASRGRHGRRDGSSGRGRHESLDGSHEPITLARNRTLAFRGSSRPAAEIGRELGVQHLVEGTVRRSGNRVRISAQLMRTADQTYVWSETYEGELSDALALEEHIGGEIARRVVARIAPRTTPRARPVDSELFDLYLRGRHYWNQRTPSSNQRARSIFEEVVQRDSGLGDCWMTAGNIEAALAAAEQAVSLDPRLAEA